MAETYMGHIRNDIPYNGIKASYRYKNPGAAYPDSYSKMFGATEFGRIGGNHPIAKFDTFEQGIASNLYKFFTSKKNYLGHSFKKAFTTWSDNPRNAPLYYKNLKYNGQLITDSTIVQREMIYDQQFVKDLWLQVLKIEAAGDTQYLQEMINAFPGAHKLAIDMAKGNPVSFPEPTAPIGEPGTQPTSFRGTGTGTGPLLGEGGLLGGLFSSGGLFGTQGGLGTLSGSLIGSGAIPTSSISSAISSSLPSALANLPSASTISSGLAESIQSGQGFTPFTSAVQSIASADTPVGRLSAIGDVATQYEAEIKALVPSLAGLNFKEAIPAIVGLEDQGPSQRLVSALKVMEGVDPDKLMTVGDVLKGNDLEDIKKAFENIDNLEKQPLSTIFDISKLDAKEQILMGIVGRSEDILDTAIENNKIDLIYAKALYGNKEEQAKALQYLTKGNLPDIEGLEESLPTLLSGSLEEITKTPLVSGFMDGKIGQILTGEESKVKSILTDLGASALTEATGISGDTSKTLLAGGTEEEIKKMRKEIGGIALDGFIESNPTLKRIIDWFYNNQHLLTLLGTAGSVAALTSLAGGGPVGGFMAGAGSMMAARAMLGEEGYNEFLHMMRETAGPVFNTISDVLHETGLADVPIVGSMLTGVLDLGRENPLAAISALSGNFGAAAGIMTSESGIGIFEEMTSESGIGIFEEQTKTLQNIENMQSSLVTDTQVPQDIALGGSITGRNDMRTTPQNGYEQGDGFMADISGEPGLPKSTSPFELVIHNETQYNDWGSSGLGNMVGGLT